jgi:branched-chain amino acid aminotransferase
MSVMPSSPAWVWCDGGWFCEDDFHLHPADRGVLHGMGAFETMRAEGGVILRAEAHLSRFLHAVSFLGLLHTELGNLHSVVAELCERNQCAEGIARIRLTATAGVRDTARCWLTAGAWCETAAPVVLGILPWRRNEHSSLAGIKSTSYAENLVAMRYARACGWNEGIFLNSADAVCEAIMANVFVQRAGEILTPPLSSGCLPGVMRGEIVALGLASEASLGADDLLEAEAIWISSALRGVVPVQSINGVEKPPRDFPWVVTV